MVTDLTGMELANASLLDESTAAAEAMTMLYELRNRDQKKNNVTKFFVSEEVLPQTISLLYYPSYTSRHRISYWQSSILRLLY